MKNPLTKLALLATLVVSAALPTQAAGLKTEAILGVWKLTKFATVKAGGIEKTWCPGVFGTLTYMPTHFMTVSLNCKEVEPGSQAEELGGRLFYSGPFEVDTQAGEVIHRARNFSHPSLNRVQRRKVTMKGPNQLNLTGELGAGRRVILEWTRQESFAFDNQPLTGVYELVGSRNQVGDRSDVPFCTGFFGSILFTPGGHAAVSINCGHKKDAVEVEPADMFGRKYFYSGRYTQQDGMLTITPDNASEDSQIGKAVPRTLKLEGDLLSLEGFNGSKFIAEWRKLGGFVGL